MSKALTEVVPQRASSSDAGHQQATASLAVEDEAREREPFLDAGALASWRFDGATVGTLADLDTAATPQVDFPSNIFGRPLEARSTVGLSPAEVGRAVVLIFEDADPRKPIVIGVVKPAEELRPKPAGELRAATEEDSRPQASGSSEGGGRAERVALLDGERVTLTAEKEIVLSCGQASITLTRAGKVIIRGEYVLSRSAGVNRIKGASIQIN